MNWKKSFAVVLVASFLILKAEIGVVPITAYTSENEVFNNYTSEIEINETNFPDKIFRDYVEEYDDDNNGSLSEVEIANIITIEVDYKNITNLKGIEYFSFLKELNCRNNALTSLDVSKNTELTHLICDGNNLGKLDISRNTKLTTLACGRSNLNNIDVSKNLDLEVLLCESNNLESLDVKNNLKLVALYCTDNELTNINVSNNSKLLQLGCSDNQLTSIDITNNPLIKVFNCDNNDLYDVDITNNPMLEEFRCNNNNLDRINVSKNLELKTIECNNNNISTLDVTNNLKLTSLDCSSNKLSNIDVTKNTGIVMFLCSNNLINYLDLSNNLMLSILDVKGCPLLWINVGNNTRLESKIDLQTEKTIDITKNQFDLTKAIKGIDISKVTIISNGILKGNIVTVDDITKPVVYLYSDKNVKITVTLNLNLINSVSNDSEISKAAKTGDQKSIKLWSVMFAGMGILISIMKKRYEIEI